MSKVTPSVFCHNGGAIPTPCRINSQEPAQMGRSRWFHNHVCKSLYFKYLWKTRRIQRFFRSISASSPNYYVKIDVVHTACKISADV
jgi:hypothetical protein